MTVCKGCNTTFKRSGLFAHLHKTPNPSCKTYLKRIQHDNIFWSEIENSTENQIHIPEFNVDDDGDIFGDFANYSEADWGMDIDDETEPTSVNDQTNQDVFDLEDEDRDLYMATMAEEELGMEPERAPRPLSPTQSIHMNDTDSLITIGKASRLRGGFEEELKNEPFKVRFGGQAGAVLKEDTPSNNSYSAEVGANQNLYAPFASELDWKFARWAKLRGPGSTSVTELMAIEGLVERLGLSFKNSNELNKIIDKYLPGRPAFKRHEVMIGNEVCEVFFRDIIACIRALFGDPNFDAVLVLVPEKHYTDEGRRVRMYHDMNTGRWWWSTQKALEQECPGATIIPILLSTDKTQLTSFRNKNAYPLYLTIGNIPKEIRRKPSLRAYVLLAYLPTTRLENVTNKTQRRRMVNNLYHSCMHKILEPLEVAGISGVNMSTGSGSMHRIHPIFAGFIGDYPEQILSSGGITGECPSCEVPRDKLGEDDIYPKRDLEAVLQVLDSFEADPAGFLQACSEAGIKPLVNPFWKNLPYANIYRSIMPDVLHQLYQGIIKHMVSWVTEACGSEEVDARCRRFPPNHNLRHFNKGISSLSCVTGQEHDQMCRILIGLVLDCRLPQGFSNVRLIRVVRALLDFVYLAQYPIHTDDTLVLLEDALDLFHENKSIFIDLGIRNSFNLPKLHFAKHYVELIKLFGTTDNYNTEYTERLHIDLAKHAFAATNYKDEFTQMTIWLERKEKVHRHEQYIQWRQDGSPLIARQEWLAPGLELDRALSIAKHPNTRSTTLDSIELDYGAQDFKTALRRYIVIANHGRMASAQLERALWDVRLPFRRLPVWHRLKFLRLDPATSIEQTADSIHAHPARMDLRERTIPGRFDTALINDGTGGDAGLHGYRIGRIRVIFSLPPASIPLLFDDGFEVPRHLAYVEWYSPFAHNPDRNHLLYKISPLRDHEGRCICSIIPVGNIRRSVHLLPKFGSTAPAAWTSSTVLDLCDDFYFNIFTDRHLYRIASS